MTLADLADLADLAQFVPLACAAVVLALALL